MLHELKTWTDNELTHEIKLNENWNRGFRIVS